MTKPEIDKKRMSELMRRLPPQRFDVEPQIRTDADWQAESLGAHYAQKYSAESLRAAHAKQMADDEATWRAVCEQRAAGTAEFNERLHSLLYKIPVKDADS